MCQTYFYPLSEDILLKEHLHFTIDSLRQQGAVLLPTNPAKNKLLLCKLDVLNKIVKRPNH